MHISHSKNFCETTATVSSGKRQYQPPTLAFFGNLATLTQSGSQACQGDNAICNPAPTNKGKGTLSDQNAKENIVRVGTHAIGIGLYLFDYKPEFRDVSGHGRQFGVMAQEVELVMPEAVVVHPDGHKMVDYGLLGITRTDQ